MTPICNFFEQTSSHACLNLSKCENVRSELNISNIKAGFTADKDSSVIFNSTGHLETFVDDCDVNLTDYETIISIKAVKTFKRLKKKL